MDEIVKADYLPADRVRGEALIDMLVVRGDELLSEGSRFLRRVSKAALILALSLAISAVTVTLLFGVLVGWLISG